MEDTIGD